jgi:hypothetical protein
MNEYEAKFALSLENWASFVPASGLLSVGCEQSKASGSKLPERLRMPLMRRSRAAMAVRRAAASLSLPRL